MCMARGPEAAGCLAGCVCRPRKRAPTPSKGNGPSTELQGLDTPKGRPGRNRALESAGQERASGHGSASLAPSGCGPGSRDSRSESRGPVGRSCLG